MQVVKLGRVPIETTHQGSEYRTFMPGRRYASVLCIPVPVRFAVWLLGFGWRRR